MSNVFSMEAFDRASVVKRNFQWVEKGVAVDWIASPPAAKPRNLAEAKSATW